MQQHFVCTAAAEAVLQQLLLIIARMIYAPSSTCNPQLHNALCIHRAMILPLCDEGQLTCKPAKSNRQASAGVQTGKSHCQALLGRHALAHSPWITTGIACMNHYVYESLLVLLTCKNHCMCESLLVLLTCKNHCMCESLLVLMTCKNHCMCESLLVLLTCKNHCMCESLLVLLTCKNHCMCESLLVLMTCKNHCMCESLLVLLTLHPQNMFCAAVHA
jgi:hypothetical protein